MATATDHQELASSLIAAGWRPSEVERRLTEQAPWLDREARDALWLFSWSYEALGKSPASRSQN